MQLYKTTVVIWSEYPTATIELSKLARETEEGDAYCSNEVCTRVEDVYTDPDWDGTEFFGIED